METTSPGKEEHKSEEKARLHSTVESLTKIARDLEKELARMVAGNAELQRAWDEERQKTAQEEKRSAELRANLERLESESDSAEDLRAGIAHLEAERGRLAASASELERQLAGAKQDRERLNQLAEALRAKRDDALEDQRIGEAQFDRALKLVEELKARLALLAEECEGLRSRVRAHEAQARVAEQQRDTLKAEIDDSARALEEIRAFLRGACLLQDSPGET
jgi:chromosome segregation ATPase